jgi:diguanylate cyclase (GGDEF)-like protein
VDVGKMFKLEEGETTVGRSHKAKIHLDDDSISRLHIKISLETAAVAVEDLGSSNGTLVNGERITKRSLQDGDKIRLGETTILKFTFHDRLDEKFQQKMYDAALRDALTRAYNKKYFLQQLALEFSYARRHGTPLTLIIFDLDHFKNVNDTYGHVAGDHVLIELANLTHRMLRAEDVFARYGGEEFVIILRGIPLHGAGTLAERLRASVESSSFVFEGQRMPVTISIGVAAFNPELAEAVSLVEAADAALYEAKRSGRNKVLLKYGSMDPRP